MNMHKRVRLLFLIRFVLRVRKKRSCCGLASAAAIADDTLLPPVYWSVERLMTRKASPRRELVNK